jgi:hypothetical protein
LSVPILPVVEKHDARFGPPRQGGLIRPRPVALLERLGDPRRLATTLLLLTFLAGGFSLHRLDPELRRFGELAYVRAWLVLAWIAVLSFPRNGRGPERKPRGVALYTHALAASQVYIALTALWSADAEGTMPRVVGQLVLALLLELAWVVVRREPVWTARAILNGSLWAALVFAAAGLGGGAERGRMAMFFGGPNVFIRVIGAGLFAAVYRALAARRLAWLAPAPVLVVCAIESGSRGGLLALLFTLPALGWAIATSGVLRRRPRWWLAAPLAGTLVLAAAGVSVLSRDHVRRYVEERYLVYAPGSYEAAEVDFGSRDRLFAAAWETFLDRPAFGAGLSAIGDFEQLDAHPHNLFLATARDGGLAGLMLLGVPLALVAGRLRRPLDIEQRMAFVLGWFYLCAAQFSGSYYDCRFLWLYFLVVMIPNGGVRTFHQSPPAVRRLRAISVRGPGTPWRAPTGVNWGVKR